MRILFVSPNSFPPQTYGGIETATLDLCASLREHGHEAAVMSGLATRDRVWLSNRIKSVLFRRRFPADWFSRIPIFRGWHLGRNLPELQRAWRPDAVVVQARNADSHIAATAALQLGIPTAYYVHDVGVIRDAVALEHMEGARWIANSNFTAGEIRKTLGIEAQTIPVLVRRDAYHTESSRRFVTMINPRRMKGGHIAMQLAARCPDIPFLFIEAWEVDHSDVLALKRDYPNVRNVTWLRSRPDMRTIYSQTRILLAPSQCEETWGRVVTEAQFSGIPALVSRLGALPETMGPGGLSVAPDAEMQEWTAALRAMWDDANAYEKFASAALAHSARADLSEERITQQLVQVLQ